MKTKQLIKRKDALANSLSFNNKKEEIKILSEIVNQDFVDAIKSSLESRNISQTNLAKEIGVSKSYVSQVFNGNRHVNMSFITRIRRKYEIPLELVDTSRYYSNITIAVFTINDTSMKKEELPPSNPIIDIPHIEVQYSPLQTK